MVDRICGGAVSWERGELLAQGGWGMGSGRGFFLGKREGGLG